MSTISPNAQAFETALANFNSAIQAASKNDNGSNANQVIQDEIVLQADLTTLKTDGSAPDAAIAATFTSDVLDDSSNDLTQIMSDCQDGTEQTIENDVFNLGNLSENGTAGNDLETDIATFNAAYPNPQA